jgi:hypothetical protein
VRLPVNRRIKGSYLNHEPWFSRGEGRKPPQNVSGGDIFHRFETSGKFYQRIWTQKKAANDSGRPEKLIFIQF